ncbi:hypothetical protein [Methanosphaera sp. WGK6]|uniref:hypothetical protein n=1 Tax=Methanosphaera sp. WGK6 TaxID=1561964 RepID=UPI00084C5C34|nr:hypothetical protein [Methanosphaera sp. WGK6]OED30173.1 hypothetical protein NL43_04560 [Methanosphaera sp. WGK6]
MSFIDKIKEKLISKSNSYNFYKTNYNILKLELDENKKIMHNLIQENNNYKMIKSELNEIKKINQDLTQQISGLEKENAVLYNENKLLIKENRKQFKVDERQSQILKELIKINETLKDNFNNFNEKNNELNKKIEYDNVISSNNYKNIELLTNKIQSDLEKI